MAVVLVVSIVRKVAQSERDCSLTKKKKKKLANVSVGHFSLEKRRLKTCSETSGKIMSHQ